MGSWFVGGLCGRRERVTYCRQLSELVPWIHSVDGLLLSSLNKRGESVFVLMVEDGEDEMERTYVLTCPSTCPANNILR